MDDDVEIPQAHRHDLEGARFRDWRARHPGGSWERYQQQKRKRSAAASSEPRSPEEAQREFRGEHDTGDLDEGEKALLQMGIAPRLTPFRILVRFGGGLAAVLLGIAFLVGLKLSVLAAIPIALLGVGVFVVALVGPLLSKLS